MESLHHSASVIVLKPRNSCPYISTNKLVQPIRQTLTSQFRKNPFVRNMPSLKIKSNRSISQNFMEFSNYKTIPVDEYEKKSGKETITGEDTVKSISLKEEVKSKTLESKIKGIKKPSSLIKETTKDCMNEMLIEINMSLMLTSSIEKEFKIISTFKPITLKEIVDKAINLDKKCAFKNTIILDLDETLIHTFTSFTNNSVQDSLPVMNCTIGENGMVQFVKRPYLEHFLFTLSKSYEVIVRM